MKSSKPLVSIIVPVYNTKDYLADCLDSLIGQSYKNLEILLIDDGSTDGSAVACDKYAARDRRVRVVHRENTGAAAARNYGIKLAAGDFVCFVDSDDTISSDFVETLYMAIASTGSSSSSSSRMTQVAPGETICDRADGDILAMRGTEATRNMLYLRNPNMNAPCKMFKTSIVKRIEFPDEVMGEDFYFTYLALMASDRVAVVPRNLYFYTRRCDSTVRKRFSEKRLGDFRLAYRIYETCPEDMKGAAKFRLFMSCFYVIANAPVSYIVRDRKSRRAKAIREYRHDILRDCHATSKFRLIAAAASINVVLAQVMYRLWIRMAR